MTALASTDVTVTATPLDIIKLPNGCLAFTKVTFGDGALTYPTGGVPLPAIGLMGDFKVAIRSGTVLSSTLTGYIHKYDITNHKIVMYYGDYSESSDGPLIECTTGYAPAANSYYLLLWGH